MPYKEKEIQKMYYSISEVAKLFDVAPSLLRFWETEFDILRPKKTSKGNRLYTQKDIDNLRLIYHLVKEKGFTLDGARKKLKEKNTNDTQVHAEVISRLKNIRSFIEKMYNDL